MIQRIDYRTKAHSDGVAGKTDLGGRVEVERTQQPGMGGEVLMVCSVDVVAALDRSGVAFVRNILSRRYSDIR
jgi:hypothetical protein